MRSIRLFLEDAQPVAGEALEKLLGANAVASDILKYPLIHVGTEKAWRLWFESQGIAFAAREFDLVVEDHELAVAAIRSGLGVGLSRPMWRNLVDDVLLFHVSPSRVPLPLSNFMVRASHRPLRNSAERWALAVMNDAGVGELDSEAFLR